MGLDECSYARQMGAIKALMESLPPEWRPTARMLNERDSHTGGDTTWPTMPGPRRPVNSAVEPLV